MCERTETYSTAQTNLRRVRHKTLDPGRFLVGSELWFASPLVYLERHQPSPDNPDLLYDWINRTGFGSMLE